MKAQHTLRFWVREALRGALPAGGWERLDRARRWRHYRRAGAVFVHVPKAAGSSIATALYGRRLGHHPACRLMQEDPASWAALEKFSVLREPVARFLSAFSYALAGGTREGAIRWRAEYDDPVLRDVNAFVLDYLVRGELLDKDVVFWPQSHFVRDAGGEAVPDLDLFTVDDPQPLAAYLASLGYAAPARINRGPAAAGLRLEIGADARRRLEAIYAADFALFRDLGKRP
jgi:hypothetical protein